MRNFLLREMLLASAKERRARRVVFHPEITIIKGGNETGKSCLIKSIFRTFGAEPAKLHPSWKSADVRSLVRFDVNGKAFAMLRHGDTYALFDSRDQHIKSFQSVTKDLAPYFAELVGFGLRLPNREGELIPLPPAFYFLPFYMDQDASWSNAWAGFMQLQMFANWRQSVAEYHAGIRGNDFYAAKARMLESEKELGKTRRKREGLQEIYTALQDRFDVAQFNVDFSAYQVEVEELLRRCDTLRRREEQFKARLAELRNKRDALKTQLDITTHAKAEASADFDFAAGLPTFHDEVQCPTCGAGYTNSFAERFAIARDEDRCADLSLQLTTEIAEVDALIDKELAAARKLADEITGIDRLLARKEGEIALGDVIRQESRRELREVMTKDLQDLERQEGSHFVAIQSSEQRMKALDNRNHRADVNGFFHEKMKQALLQLDVQTIADNDIRRVDSSIKATGSELTRALLGYQLAFLHAAQKFGSAAFAPIVIDSPNQQDQDERHLQMILRYIRDARPEGTQLIMGLVDTADQKFGGTEIMLEDKYHLLSEDEYEKVSGEVRVFIEKALKPKQLTLP